MSTRAPGTFGAVQRLAWPLRDGRVVRGPVPAGFGPPDQATPAGSFRVAWKDREHTSGVYSAAFFDGLNVGDAVEVR